MEQEWFYAEGEASVGPLSSEALIGALRRMPEPGKTLVWHDGLTAWQPAADTPELAARIAKPPLADAVVALDPTLDRWNGPSSEAEVGYDDGLPVAERRQAPVAVAVIALAIAIAGGAMYAPQVLRMIGEGEIRVVLPQNSTRPQPGPQPQPAKPDPAAVLAQLTETAGQAAAATDAIALKFWASIEPQAMQSQPNLATASRSDLEEYLRALQTAEANAVVVQPQYAALLNAERGLIEEAARSSGLDEGSWTDLLAAVGERHGKSLERAGRMLQARQDLYRAMQATQAIAIAEFGKYKVDAGGHVRFLNKAAMDRAVAATERVNAASQALDRIELEMAKAQWQAPQPAWKDMMIKEWKGTP